MNPLFIICYARKIKMHFLNPAVVLLLCFSCVAHLYVRNNFEQLKQGVFNRESQVLNRVTLATFDCRFTFLQFKCATQRKLHIYSIAWFKKIVLSFKILWPEIWLYIGSSFCTVYATLF